jgi:hypothetical protein
MPRKNTRNTVLAMLSSAGAETRPTAPASPRRRRPTNDETDPADREQGLHQPADAGEMVTANEPSAQPSSGTMPTRRRARPAAGTSVDAGTDDQPHAPRTLRLSQAVASQLRAAWLEARRADDVLLTQQDHARSVISRGLRAAGARRRAPADAQSDSTAAPATLRLDQGTANQLRAAWLDARRAGDVLVSHRAFADGIVLTGLFAPRV